VEVLGRRERSDWESEGRVRTGRLVVGEMVVMWSDIVRGAVRKPRGVLVGEFWWGCFLDTVTVGLRGESERLCLGDESMNSYSDASDLAKLKLYLIQSLVCYSNNFPQVVIYISMQFEPMVCSNAGSMLCR